MSETLADAIAAADRQLDGSVAATTAGRESSRDAAHGHRYVLLSIASANYAVREVFVTELERVPKITPVPRVPAWVRGAAVTAAWFMVQTSRRPPRPNRPNGRTSRTTRTTPSRSSWR